MFSFFPFSAAVAPEAAKLFFAADKPRDMVPKNQAYSHTSRNSFPPVFGFGSQGTCHFAQHSARPLALFPFYYEFFLFLPLPLFNLLDLSLCGSTSQRLTALRSFPMQTDVKFFHDTPPIPNGPQVKM